MPGSYWTYNPDGTPAAGYDTLGHPIPLTSLRPWPPPITKEPKTFSGSRPAEINWRNTDLAIVFLATDESHSTAFVPGYQIPATIDTVVRVPGQPWTTVPVVTLSPEGGSFYRYGYWDDLNHKSAPPDSFTLSDVQQMLFQTGILVIGVAWNQSSEPSPGPVPSQLGFDDNLHWLQCVSAISGAGAEVGKPYQGHIIPATTAISGTDLGDLMFAETVAYATVRHARSVDFAFVCDNTGSMGLRQTTTKAAALRCCQRMLAAGYDSSFAYCTFADWPQQDYPSWYGFAGSAAPSDLSYSVRFPFTPLTPTSAAAFSALTINGESGADSPEDALEALGRALFARFQIPPLRQRQRGDTLLARGQRAGGIQQNAPQSRQGSSRQGGKNTFYRRRERYSCLSPSRR